MVNRYGYPIDDAAAVACDEVRKFLESEDGGKVSLLVLRYACRSSVANVVPCELVTD